MSNLLFLLGIYFFSNSLAYGISFLVILELILGLWFMLAHVWGLKNPNYKRELLRNFLLYYLGSIFLQILAGSLVSLLVILVLLIIYGIKKKAPWKIIFLSSGLMLVGTFFAQQFFSADLPYGGEIHLLPIMFTSAGTPTNLHNYPLSFSLDIPIDLFNLIRLGVEALVEIILLWVSGKKIWKLTGSAMFYFFVFGAILLFSFWSSESFPCLSQKPIAQWMSCPKVQVYH